MFFMVLLLWIEPRLFLLISHCKVLQDKCTRSITSNILKSHNVTGYQYNQTFWFIFFLKQDMTDDLDHYTNTYLIYSKDPMNCQKFLGSSEVINWKQHLQIQSKRTWVCGGCCYLLCIHGGNHCSSWTSTLYPTQNFTSHRHLACCCSLLWHLPPPKRTLKSCSV